MNSSSPGVTHSLKWKVKSEQQNESHHDVPAVRIASTRISNGNCDFKLGFRYADVNDTVYVREGTSTLIASACRQETLNFHVNVSLIS